jgi:hypothetical protein
MGWSYTAAAGCVMDKWTNACIAQTGSQNTFKVDGNEYFWEASNKEHDDGHVSGSIHKMNADGTCRRVGSFYIDPNGNINVAPKFLKDAGK